MSGWDAKLFIRIEYLGKIKNFLGAYKKLEGLAKVIKVHPKRYQYSYPLLSVPFFFLFQSHTGYLLG